MKKKLSIFGLILTVLLFVIFILLAIKFESTDYLYIASMIPIIIVPFLPDIKTNQYLNPSKHRNKVQLIKVQQVQEQKFIGEMCQVQELYQEQEQQQSECHGLEQGLGHGQEQELGQNRELDQSQDQALDQSQRQGRVLDQNPELEQAIGQGSSGRLVISFEPSHIDWQRETLYIKLDGAVTHASLPPGPHTISMAVLKFDLKVHPRKKNWIGISLKNIRQRTAQLPYTTNEINRLIIQMQDIEELLQPPASRTTNVGNGIQA